MFPHNPPYTTQPGHAYGVYGYSQENEKWYWCIDVNTEEEARWAAEQFATSFSEIRVCLIEWDRKPPLPVDCRPLIQKGQLLNGQYAGAVREKFGLKAEIVRI